MTRFCFSLSGIATGGASILRIRLSNVIIVSINGAFKYKPGLVRVSLTSPNLSMSTCSVTSTIYRDCRATTKLAMMMIAIIISMVLCLLICLWGVI